MIAVGLAECRVMNAISCLYCDAHDAPYSRGIFTQYREAQLCELYRRCAVIVARTACTCCLYLQKCVCCMQLVGLATGVELRQGMGLPDCPLSCYDMLLCTEGSLYLG